MKQIISALTFALIVMAPSQVSARDGKSIETKNIVTNRAPANTERQSTAGNSKARTCKKVDAPALPFAISVDGQSLDTGTLSGEAGAARCVDLSLERADIRVSFDAGDQKRALNVDGTLASLSDRREVRFSLYSNYSAFIDRAEIRLFKTSDSTMQTPIAVLKAPVYGTMAWQPGDLQEKEITYVLRVYGRSGRFDETRPKKLALNVVRNDDRWNAFMVYGKSNIAKANIAVAGGMVTVDGRYLRPDQSVTVLNYEVPIDLKGTFAFRQILPSGPHEINVSVRDGNNQVAEFTRAVTIPDQDWFYVGLADLTIGKNRSSGPVKLVRADAKDEFDNKVFVNGRLAFYLKGKIRGDVLLTAAADTREQPIKNLFSNFTSKDPRFLLRRLDPEKYYPVYGDDSTLVEDAPTQGKFYVRLERGDSHVMWGNFHTTINGTDFMQFRRGLYGGKLKWVSEQTTSHGEKRARLDLFAAEPGSLPARDEFRGTGGSLYYLRRQDITQGSEQVWIELRDKDTGLVLQKRALKAETDFDVNYLQGRVVLTVPLPSTADDNNLIRTGSLSGHKQYLVVSYEYTPGLTRTNELSIGGRASLWANDHVQIGATGYRQDGTKIGQKAGGIDATLRYKPGTYIKGELARSSGVGTSSNLSQDGGYTFFEQSAGGQTANAFRIEAAMDLFEVSNRPGRLYAYWQQREKGFSSPGFLTGSVNEAREAGVSLIMPLDVEERTNLKIKGTQKRSGADETKALEASVEHKVDENWTVTTGVRADDKRLKNGATASADGEGHRVDLAAKVRFRPSIIEGEAPWSVYGFGQATVSKDGKRRDNHRGGAGGEVQVTQNIKATGELSAGTGGFGALSGLEYKVDDNTTLYLNYRLDTDSSQSDVNGRYGVLTTGGRTRFTDNLSVFAEERYYHGDGPVGLASAFGLDYAFYDHWNFGINAEFGELNDPNLGDLDRKAGGITLGYARTGFKYVSSLEGRFEEGTQGKRKTILSRNVVTADLNEDFRLLTRFNASWSDSSKGQFYDANYMEGVAAFAYRPVDNDRLNALFKYTFFADLPTTDQLNGDGALSDFAQRSHVLALDASYDIVPMLTLGGKYALRVGELRDNRVDGEWFTSTAQLGIARLDLHVVHDWDLVLEARVLDLPDAGDRKYGALAAVYRHINDNLKVGLDIISQTLAMISPILITITRAGCSTSPASFRIDPIEHQSPASVRLVRGF